MRPLALLVEGVGQPGLDLGVVGGHRQGLAEFGLGLVGVAVVQQGLGQVLPQGEILGGELQGLAEGLDRLVTAGHWGASRRMLSDFGTRWRGRTTATPPRDLDRS